MAASNPLTHARQVTVTTEAGTTEVVEVRLLPVRELYTFGRHIAETQMPEAVAFACGRPIEWLDGLIPESYAALTQEVFAANFPRVAQVMAGDPTLAAALLPVVVKFADVAALEPQLRDLAKLTMPQVGMSGPSPSPESSPESPSSPDGPGTTASTPHSRGSSRSSKRPTAATQSAT